MKLGMKQKQKGKCKKVFTSIVISLIAVLALYAAFCWIAPPLVYPDFYRIAEPVHTIPNLLGGFVPQGVTKTTSGSILVCGYMQQDEPSRIYRIDSDGTVTEILLMREDGSVYGGHAGGLTATNDFVYISNAHKIFVLDLSAVQTAANGDTLQFLGHFDVPCNSSFCSSDGTMLYVGEYHAAGYETDEAHAIETADGTTCRALVFAFRLDADQPRGVTETPEAAYATCDKVQGFAIASSGTAYLSCSAGLADSELKCYDVTHPAERTFSFEDRSIPLTVLDSARQIENLRMPHMSEDLDVRDGVLLMGFEAGALKFGAGLLPFSIHSVTALKIEAE